MASGTGHQAFEPIEGALETKTDFNRLKFRTEYHCANCGGHQDMFLRMALTPTGLRYCNNGIALDFMPGMRIFLSLEHEITGGDSHHI
ncbi:MAG: peptide-methionine (R)-S-oxide reductase [Deinococcales bacterium]